MSTRTTSDTYEKSTRSHGRDVVMEEWMEMKILVLPSILADQQLDGINYNCNIWQLMMEAILETHDLAPMVLTKLDKTDYSNLDTLSLRRLRLLERPTSGIA